MWGGGAISEIICHQTSQEIIKFCVRTCKCIKPVSLKRLQIGGPEPAQPHRPCAKTERPHRSAGGEVVGTISSAGIGHRTGHNIAMGFIRLGDLGDLTVDVLGEPRSANEIDACVYDPDNTLVKS